jgi:hypothetical protein
MQLICGFWEHSNCPWCHEENETTTHVLTCDGDDVSLEWELQMDNVESWLLEVDSHPSIVTCVMTALATIVIYGNQILKYDRQF